MDGPPITPQLRKVLTCFDAEAEPEPLYGYEIMQVTGLKSGTVYPLLARLEQRGWVRSAWSDKPPTGHPPQRHYWLTEDGDEAVHELA